jgi:hypothetical protein
MGHGGLRSPSTPNAKADSRFSEHLETLKEYWS